MIAMDPNMITAAIAAFGMYCMIQGTWVTTNSNTKPEISVTDFATPPIS